MKFSLVESVQFKLRLGIPPNSYCLSSIPVDIFADWVPLASLEVLGSIFATRIRAGTMIHLDRNHHPSPLETTQNKHLILPTNPIAWPALDDDYSKDDYAQVSQKSAPGPMTPQGATDPRPASGPSSPASPADGNSASPTRDRSSSLSPAPSPRPPPPDATAAASRQSTPLSELSPPPDDFDDDPPKQEDTSDKQKDAPASAPASPPKADDHDSKQQQQQSSNPMPAASPSNRTSPPGDSIATPSAAGTQSTSPAPGDPKVAIMLELNEELLKVCMEFQKQKMELTEPQFQAYSLRLQTNLAWSASVVDQNRQHGSQAPALPMMDAPPPVDSYPTERIQELYQELPVVFAKELARQAAAASSSLSLKRDRSAEDISGDLMMNKRRDTGENKVPAAMMPPPPIPSPVANSAAGNPFPTSGANGMGSPLPPQMTDPSIHQPFAPQNNANPMDTPLRTRAQQAQAMRAQQARDMSPPGGNIPNMNNGLPGGNNVNAIAGPSGSFNIASMPPHIQNMYTMLQNPNHAFVQYMIRNVPGFQQMPVPMQLQKMVTTHSQIQQQNRERQQQMSPMQNNGVGGGGFPGQTSPVSPIASMGGPSQSPQNPMFPMNASMDLRAMNSTPLPGGGGGMNMGMNGMNISPQQRQLLLMQQQQRGGGGGGGGGMGNPNPGMGMSPQQMAFQQQQQERMRMEQQRMAGAPLHTGSPMMGNEFPALRSNASIPGIARIARSPSDGSQGSMTPRIAPARGGSMGAEDYQRVMMQQRSMGGQNPGFNPQQFQQLQQQQPGWQQNQMQQQQAMQMHGGGGGGSGGGYGMGGRPGSGYGGGAPSPPGSGQGMPNQNWGGSSGYPFAASPGSNADQVQAMQRHMSGTPAPQIPDQGDFDPFNWA
ncbi:hypothetical protein C8J57DRAFT_1675892 [Mycena rebaudengoi]|nr:hypothetical protein C8J57DRAFT_1675892 [Mycena rebaudengoi]